MSATDDRLDADERDLLRQTVTKLYRRRGDPRRPALSRAEVWAELAALGLVGIVVPREFGGGGGGLCEAGLVCELRGQSCDFGAYPETVAAGFGLSTAVDDLGTDGEALLSGVAEEGWQLVPVDLAAPDQVHSLIPAGASRTFAVWRGPGGGEVGWQELDPLAGEAVVSTARDGEHKVHLDENALPAPALTGAAASRMWSLASRALEALRYAEIAGACRWLQQDTARYARQRVQFARPIAQFQAVQHQLVDLLAWVDAGELLVRHALLRIADGAGARELARAGAFLRDHTWDCLFGSYNVLGGMGFVEEMPVNRYTRGVLGVLSRLGPVREVEQRSAEHVARGRWLVDQPAGDSAPQRPTKGH